MSRGPGARRPDRQHSLRLRNLVVWVYDRRSWYYPIYRFGSPAVRRPRDWIGEPGLRVTLFPLWHAAVLALLALSLRRPHWLPLDMSWHLFHDQLTTLHCTFHTAEELESWAGASAVSRSRSAVSKWRGSSSPCAA